mmetsp:Transcript_9088/g.26118  ORF Transcript_9088/g.26118 Transcript_9088/m.26118 type:complete len:203 (-) Transcript_9088:1549-2157(-)
MDDRNLQQPVRLPGVAVVPRPHHRFRIFGHGHPQGLDVAERGPCHRLQVLQRFAAGRAVVLRDAVPFQVGHDQTEYGRGRDCPPHPGGVQVGGLPWHLPMGTSEGLRAVLAEFAKGVHQWRRPVGPVEHDHQDPGASRGTSDAEDHVPRRCEEPGENSPRDAEPLDGDALLWDLGSYLVDLRLCLVGNHPTARERQHRLGGH